MQRRHFIKQTTFAGLGTALSAPACQPALDTDILILGGGIPGLSLACYTRPKVVWAFPEPLMGVYACRPYWHSRRADTKQGWLAHRVAAPNLC